ncbi:flagellar hook-length control protein FliK [Undibacterium arcticum]
MMLPADTRIGSSLPMTLVSTEPRPVFLLGADASAAVLAAELAAHPAELLPTIAQQSGTASSAVGKATLDSYLFHQTDLSGAESGASSTTLSSAGRLIDSLLHAVQQGGAPTAVLGKSPLVNAPTVGADRIAEALHGAVATSGLFYESHVVEWADGKREMSDLLREPQTQLGNSVSNDTKTTASIGNEAAQLINAQLNTLEHQRLQWQGEVWPGQRMDWQVSQDAPEGGDRDGPELQSWQSAVRFELPGLGVVSATIHLLGENLHIQLRTATETTATALRDHSQQLADALGAAGSPLDSLTVKQDECAG